MVMSQPNFVETEDMVKIINVLRALNDLAQREIHLLPWIIDDGVDQEPVLRLTDVNAAFIGGIRWDNRGSGGKSQYVFETAGVAEE